MEAKGELNSGVTVKGHEAPETYRLAPRTENSFPNPNPNHDPNPNPISNLNPYPNSNTNPNPNPNPNPNVNSNNTKLGEPTVTASPAGLGADGKKKRGRPRKYAPDGSLNTALSPMPISASIPLAGAEFSTWKRGKARSSEAVKKQHKYDYESRGDRVAYFVGANFTPHVLTVHAGEDVTMKVMSFSQQGSRAICILCANGTISNVTLRQPTSSGGTLTYEGRFEILSLSGSFMPTDSGGTKSRSGGMSISLAGPDGRVVGGGLAGFLVAAGPVQVVVGTFLPGHQQEQKHKKQRIELPPAIAPINAPSVEEMRGVYGGVKPVLVAPSSFHGGNSVPTNNTMEATRNSNSDNKTSSPEDESDGPDLSNYEESS
ncbi:AT-hook motif nuclear-localized protein 6 [Euphorbia peplus]|nr:AT-hook motif nuclear-localized protein 6 [Euphorbia peplus]